MNKSHAAVGTQLQCAPRQRFAGLLLGAALTLGASGFAAISALAAFAPTPEALILARAAA